MYGDIVESRRIKAYEENASWLGVSTLNLMECAGKCVAEFVHKNFKVNEYKRVIVVTGKGGNAGDGFVAARHLASLGYEVDVVLLYSDEQITHPDAKTNFLILRKIEGGRVKIWDFDKLNSLLSEGGIVIDAILGTGIRGELRFPISDAIEKINASGNPVIAVDIPSGIDPDSGRPAIKGGEPLAIKASYTITMHYYKPGLAKPNEYAGKIELCNVGIPEEAEIIIGPGDVRNLLSLKSKDAKKGDGGVVTVIGGSVEYTGAPSLASLAALVSGSDLVFTAVPRSIKDVVSSFSPSIIAVEAGKDYLSQDYLPSLLPIIEKSHAIVVGPGMAYNETTCSFTEQLLKIISTKPLRAVVLDADALKCISTFKPKLNDRFVLTPHRGELSRLLSAYGIPESGDRKKDSMVLSTEIGGSIVLSKGPVDYICLKNYCREKRGGNPGMSVGGTGDVLAGMVASFAKRTPNAYDAACIASFVNSYAGDELYKKYNEFFTSEMLVQEIPRALSSILVYGKG